MRKNSDIFLTPEGRAALDEIAIERREKRIEQTSQLLYEELKGRYRKLNQCGAAGATEIIYCMERKTGKTTAIMRLAEELGVIIVTDNHFLKFYNRTAQDKDMNIATVTLQSLRTKWDEKRFNFHTVLVDETTDVQEVREVLNEVALFGTPVNIIAIQ